MIRQPLFLRLLERLIRGPHGEYVLGDIAEEYRRMRRTGQTAARWWLFRQGMGAMFYRTRESGSAGESNKPPARRPAVVKGTALFFETWIQDLRFGIRLLWRDRLVTLTIVATLSLGIGATATMYSITRGILRDLPFDNPRQLVTIGITQVEQNVRDQDVPLIDLDEWRRAQTTMVDIAGMARQAFHLAPIAGAPVRVAGAAVSPWSFRLLGVPPLLGTDFREHEAAGVDPVIIGHQLWENVFASARDVVGHTVRVDGTLRTVIGVMPDGFGFPRAEQLWIPLITGDRRSMSGATASSAMPGTQGAAVFGRVAPGFSIQDARSEFATLGRPSQIDGSLQVRPEIVEVQPFAHRFVGDDANALLYTMLAIVSSVLLIACANVTNLLLVRAAARGRELAIRAALGSTQARLSRQLLTETLIMAILGSVGGVICAVLAVDWFKTTVGHRIEIFWIAIDVDLAVLGFVIALTALSTLAVGLVPAMRGARVDVSQTLKEGRGTVSPIRMGNVTRLLVVAEIAVSVVLLVASGLMVRGVLGLSMRDVRFQTGDVVTARVRLAAFDYPDDQAIVRWYDRVERQWAEAHAGQLTFTSSLPGQPAGRRAFAIDGVPYAQHADLPATSLRFVSPTFFEAFAIHPTSGRVFDERDTMNGRPVAVVNARFAELHFDGDPVGRRVRIGDLTSSEPWREVVGVVDDLGTTLDEGRAAAGMFIPLAQSPARVVTVAVRHEGVSVENATTAVRDVVSAVDPNLPLYDTATLERALTDEIAPQRTFAILFGAFGALALALAAVGLYGTMSFSVLQRQREFGVRRALGARSLHLVTNVTRSVGLQLGIGLAIGLGLAVLVAPLLRDFTFGADPRDPLVFAVVLLTLSGTAACASLVPITRAARADPMRVLRQE